MMAISYGTIDEITCDEVNNLMYDIHTGSLCVILHRNSSTTVLPDVVPSTRIGQQSIRGPHHKRDTRTRALPDVIPETHRREIMAIPINTQYYNSRTAGNQLRMIADNFQNVNNVPPVYDEFYSTFWKTLKFGMPLVSIGIFSYAIWRRF